MQTRISVTGVILAGGLARRMGGQAKPLIALGEISILSRVIEVLRPQCASLSLNANTELNRYQLYQLPILIDATDGFLGPLAGVLAGMDAAAENQPDVNFLLSAPGDTPFLPQDLVARLYAAKTQEQASIAVAASGGRAHHTVALWDISLRETLRKALIDEGVRAVSEFIARHKKVDVDWSLDPYDPFFNVNSPEDLEIATEILAKREMIV
jgi:molybdopterin-guanine dinucleotide biosynthesis protein A